MGQAELIQSFNTLTDTGSFVPNIISIKWNLFPLSPLVDIESPADSTAQLSSTKASGASGSSRADLLWTMQTHYCFSQANTSSIKEITDSTFFVENKHSEMVISSAGYRQHKISIKLHCISPGNIHIRFPALQKEMINIKWANINLSIQWWE